MPTMLTQEFLKPYIRDGKRHQGYPKTVKIASELKIHADGEDAGTLISERRPSESQGIKDYREKIYVAITESVISKIITALSKIRRSSDWSINYDKSKIPAKIIAEETLEQYCEKNYPTYRSITKWVFDVFLKTYLVDPNAVVLTLIDSQSTDKATYNKPYTLIFDSDRVYDYMDEKYAILYSTDKSEYTLENGSKMYDGDVYYTCDNEVIQRWEQINVKKDMIMKLEIKHGLGRMPAFKVGGVLFKTLDKILIYKSRINACVPHLKEAVREYSDLQAEVVQHIHSEKWTYETQDCIKCNGTGKFISEAKQVVCSECKGKGTIPTSPYTAVTMKVPGPGETGIPGGIPMGYVQKQVDIVEIQDKRVEKHCYNALAAVNMEFLAQTPLSQSGDAKNVDRDELNTFVDSIAEDVVGAMDKVYKNINDFRYLYIVPNKKEREGMLPSIAVPQNYDLLSSNYLLQELGTAKTAGVNAITWVAMEVEYTNKKFNNNPIVRDELKAVLELDPFTGITDDVKLTRLQNGGITEEDYVISSNIYAFVRKAVELDKSFLALTLTDKKKVITKFAKEVITKNSAKAKILDPAEDPANVGGGDLVNEDIDILGKFPLALQQLALARERANTAGDKLLSKKIAGKMMELLNVIDPGPDA